MKRAIVFMIPIFLSTTTRAEITTMDVALIEDTDGSLSNMQTLSMPNVYLQKVACAFYKKYPDNFDAIFVFTTVPLDFITNTQQGWPVKQDIKGIGRELYNQAGQFCSSKFRLRQAVKMGDLSKLPNNPDDTYTGIPFYPLSGVELMGHEFGHHWLASVTFIKDGVKHCFLRGHEPMGSEPKPGDCDGYDESDYNQHWSNYFNSGGIMYGNNIIDLGDGNFRILNTEFKYGPLDQYLMGLRKPEEVGPLFLVVMSDDSTASPSIPVQKNKPVDFKGTKLEFTVDDVIASVGPRNPPSQECHWKGALIVVHPKGKPPTFAELQKVAAYGNRWETWYPHATDGRGSFDLKLDGSGKGTEQCPAKNGPVLPEPTPEISEPLPEETMPEQSNQEVFEDIFEVTAPDVSLPDIVTDAVSDIQLFETMTDFSGSCTPGERMCAGNTALVCPTDGKAWVVWAECGALRCINGECVATGSGDSSSGCSSGNVSSLFSVIMLTLCSILGFRSRRVW